MTCHSIRKGQIKYVVGLKGAQELVLLTIIVKNRLATENITIY